MQPAKAGFVRVGAISNRRELKVRSRLCISYESELLEAEIVVLRRTK
jgi:hypothetical protein